MKRQVRHLLVGLWAAASALALAADQQELKIALTQEFENPNPLVMQMATTTYIYAMVGRTLNTLDPDGKLIPQLAVTTPTLENGLAEWFTDADGQRRLRAHWELKPNAQWGDGQPVTGHDVAFARTVALSDHVSVGEKEVYSDVARVEVDPANPKQFITVFAKAKWDCYKFFGFQIIPRHLEEPVFKEFGGQPGAYEKNSKYLTDPTNPGLYNGPYRIAEVKLGSHVVLLPNPRFYGPAPAIPRITFRFIPDTATLEPNLRAGEVNFLSHLGLSLDQAIAFEKRATALPYTVHFRDGLFYEHVDLNLRNPLLQDLRVRQALMLALDRAALCDALFAGKQKPALHNVAPIDPWYTADPKLITVYECSPRRARKLLDDAGWSAGADGWRYRNGQRLSLELMTTAGDKTRESVQAWLQSEWQKIGVEIVIRNEPARVYFGETVRKGKFTALAMFAWLSSPENSPRSTCHSQSIPTEANGYSGQNAGGWQNAEVDQVLDRLDREFNAEQRLVLIHQFLALYTRELPTIPLYYRAYNAVTPRQLKGFRLSGHQFSDANEVENWHFE